MLNGNSETMYEETYYLICLRHLFRWRAVTNVYGLISEVGSGFSEHTVCPGSSDQFYAVS